jgi:DNA-binding SARP family transcriptional activator
VGALKVLFHQNVDSAEGSGHRVLEVSTFGRLTVRRGSEHLNSPPQRASRLLNYLLCQPKHSATKNSIAQGLWPEYVTAAKNLHAAAHDLRKWAGDVSVLEYADERYSLSAHIDVDDFEELLAAAWRRPRTETAAACEQLEAAVEIYSGPFLAGDNSSWAGYRRSRLEGHLCDALVSLSRFALERDSAEQALKWVERAAEVLPQREDTLRMRMRALAALGRRSEAMLLFRDFRANLRSELGCEPDPMTIATQGEILR